MQVRTHIPGPPLSRLIASMTLVEAPDYPWACEQVLPDIGVNLLVNFGPSPHTAVPPGETEARVYRRAWLAGERRGPLLVERARHGYDLLVIRFHPGGASAFFPFALVEVTDRVHELDEVWGRAVAEEVADRLAERSTPHARFVEAERILVQHLRGDRLPRTVEGALHLLARRDLHLGMRRLAAELGVTPLRLLRLFRRTVGLTPKLLQRLLRFQQAVALEAVHPEWGWSRIAHRSGYADHPHLDRDFRGFAGMSPSAYRARRADWPNYVPTDGNRR